MRDRNLSMICGRKQTKKRNAWTNVYTPTDVYGFYAYVRFDISNLRFLHTMHTILNRTLFWSPKSNRAKDQAYIHYIFTLPSLRNCRSSSGTETSFSFNVYQRFSFITTNSQDNRLYFVRHILCIIVLTRAIKRRRKEIRLPLQDFSRQTALRSTKHVYHW